MCNLLLTTNRLAELYNREMEEWKDECLANVETPEDRKHK